nr:hypothetical protein [Tanacetum cinerariifolium]
MRPFGCPVTILNTKDHLGKFDGKADEGFFVGYSLNSKAFRVFNNRTRIMEENFHIRFSENTPNIAGSGPNWLFDINALTKLRNYKPVVTGNQSNGNASTKACDDADQEKEDNVNNTNNVNAAGTNGVNAVGANTNNKLSFDPEMPTLEDISTFNFSSDHEDDDEMVDINNLDTTIQVSPIPTTRIHKDHPIDQVIRDPHSTNQTRNMSKNLEEHGFVTIIHQRTNHKDLQNCLFACFLSQEEPNKMDVKSAFLYGKIEEEKQDGIFINQGKYVAKIVKKYGFSEVKNASTPMETQKPLLKDEDGEEVHVHLYRSMIGSLMYLTSLRPDIMFTMCACVRYKVNPKVSHLYAVKRIFRYLKGQPKFSLSYLKDSPFDLIAYNDSDYAGESLDMKSTTEGCQFLGCRLISWQCITYYCWADVNVVEVYTSCIEQFWATVKKKTINAEGQLQALVDRKKILITESTVRRDLQLEDAEDVDYPPNAAIFKQLTLIGHEKISEKLTFYKAFFPQRKFLIHTILQCISAKTTVWNEFSSTMAFAIICLATNQKFYFSKYIFESMVKNLDNVNKFLMYPRVDEVVNEEMDDSLERAATTATSLDAEQNICNIFKTQSKAKPNEPGSQGTSSGGGPRCQETIGDTVAQTKSERVSKIFNDPLHAGGNTPQSGKDSLKLKKLMGLCTKLQQRVLDLETIKTTQALEIDILKRRVKKLERRKRSRTHGLKRLYKVGLSARVESSKGEDYLLAERLQAEEQQELNDEENSKLFMQLLKKRRKFFAAKRKMFDKAFKRINTFVDFRTELVEESSKKAEAEVTEGSSKRVGEELEQENAKKWKIDDDKDKLS